MVDRGYGVPMKGQASSSKSMLNTTVYGKRTPLHFTKQVVTNANNLPSSPKDQEVIVKAAADVPPSQPQPEAVGTLGPALP